VSADHDAGFWRIAVRDHGAGVDPATLEKIFEPFEHATASRQPTAGLGLAICRAIVERHGGRIWAELPDPGLTVYLTLPDLS
jgi:signal transduction histidine kinase